MPGSHLIRCALVGTASQAGHFVGVPTALKELGSETIQELTQEHAPVRLPPWSLDSVDAVLHAEPSPHLAAGIVLSSERSACPCALLMDGICDFANTFLNAEEPSLLRPPPADVVFAAGMHDRAILQALGVRAIATGLPRLEKSKQELSVSTIQLDRDALLFATARQPCHTPGSRPRLIAALSEARDLCNHLGVRTIWRIPSEIADELGVQTDQSRLTKTLLRSRAVVTTASTLVIEAMLAGIPVGVLHPNPWPLWLPAAWRYMNDGGPDAQHDRDRAQRAGPLAEAASQAASTSALAIFTGTVPKPHQDLAPFIESLLNPNEALLRTQKRSLHNLLRPQASVRTARALQAVARQHSVRQTLPKPRPKIPGKLNVFSVLESHGSTVGGVSVWSNRLERWFAEHPEEGITWRTLFVGPCAPPATESLTERPYAESIELDPTAPDSERLLHLASRLDDADVVIPNYGWLSHAAAELARQSGTRVLSIAHTDDALTRALLRSFPPSGQAIGVNDRIAEWIRTDAADDPHTCVETVLYGVPSHPPREQRHRNRTIEIVSIGRLVDAQKRVGDLIPMLAALQDRNVDCRLHLIGDGPCRERWFLDAAKAGIQPDRVVYHGALPPEHVQELLPSFDIFALTSDSEGTSIAALETMAAGVVPVITATPGMEALLTHGVDGCLCPVGEPVAMADVIEQLAADNAWLHRLAREAQHTITRRSLTVSHCATRYARILRQLWTESCPQKNRDSNHVLRAENVWRARGCSRTTELQSLVRRFGLDRDISPPTAPFSHGDFALREPGLDPDPRAHLAHAFELLRSEGPVAVSATGTRSMPELEWLARNRREDIAAFLVPAVTHGATFFGIPAWSFEQAVSRNDPVLVSHPIVDRIGLVAAVAHGLHHSTQVSFPEFAKREITKIELLLADRTRTLTNLPRGVVPSTDPCTSNELLRMLREGDHAGTTVLLRGDEDDFALAAGLFDWINAGGDLRSPSWSLAELTSPARFAQGIKRQRYTLYGAGTHTHRLLRYMPSGTTRPVAIYDDNAPSLGAEIDGVPVVKPDSDRPSPGELVILSSVAHEDELWERTAHMRRRGIEVCRLYEPEIAPGPPI